MQKRKPVDLGENKPRFCRLWHYEEWELIARHILCAASRRDSSEKMGMSFSVEGGGKAHLYPMNGGQFHPDVGCNSRCGLRI